MRLLSAAELALGLSPLVQSAIPLDYITYCDFVICRPSMTLESSRRTGGTLVLTNRRRALGFSAVLNNLSEQVGYCYRRASECRELAELTTSPSDKAFYIERERGWLLLAHSYGLQERTNLFTNELPSREWRRNALAPSCPSCATPTQVCWSTLFVCTNCRRVVEVR